MVKFAKQQAIGCRRTSMILASGRARRISPTCKKLYGHLSTKYGFDVRRFRFTHDMYFSPKIRKCSGAILPTSFGHSVPVFDLSSSISIMIKFNSPSGSIREWLPRICSTRVEPERCMPSTKIGSLEGQPEPERSRKMFDVKI